MVIKKIQLSLASCMLLIGLISILLGCGGGGATPTPTPTSAPTAIPTPSSQTEVYQLTVNLDGVVDSISITWLGEQFTFDSGVESKFFEKEASLFEAPVLNNSSQLQVCSHRLIKESDTSYELIIECEVVNRSDIGALNPVDFNVSKLFSEALQREFYFYQDAQDDNLIYYLSKNGVIASDDNANDSSPRLNVASRQGGGIYFGQEVAILGGAFDLVPGQALMNKLVEEASNIGKNISPVGVDSGRLLANVTGFPFSDTVPLAIECSDASSGEVNIKSCRATDSQGRIKPLQFFESVAAPVPEGRWDEVIGYNGSTLPVWVDSLAAFMEDGLYWDGEVEIFFEWTVFSGDKLELGEAALDWEKIFTRLVSLMQDTSWILTEVKLNDFVTQLINEQDSGLNFVLLDSEEFTEQEINRRAVLFLSKVIKQELLAEIQNTKFDVGGDNDSFISIYSLNENISRLRSANRAQTIKVLWGASDDYPQARTYIRVGCVEGGFGEPVIFSQATHCL